MKKGAKALLDFIAKLESNGDYDTVYAHKYSDLPRKITDMRLDEIHDHQHAHGKRYGSSAFGRYQFIRQTLLRLRKKLGMPDHMQFTPALQDDLAYQLLIERGFLKWLDGHISTEKFAHNLAKEWASVPVLRKGKGAHRVIQRGESYYAGDGLNHSLVAADEFETVLARLEKEAKA